MQATDCEKKKQHKPGTDGQTKKCEGLGFKAGAPGKDTNCPHKQSGKDGGETIPVVFIRPM
jgi:hypothetical protein